MIIKRSISVPPNSTECPTTTRGRPTKHTKNPKILKVVERPCYGHSIICKTPLKSEWWLKNVKTDLMSLKYFHPSKCDRVSDGHPTKHTEYPKILKVVERPCHGHSIICKIQLNTNDYKTMWKLTSSPWSVSVPPNLTECPKTTQGCPTKHTEYPKILKVVERPCHEHSIICKTPLKHEWWLKNVKTDLESLKCFHPSKFDRVSEDNSRSSH